ncbi:DUF1542 domain-containing protein [Staphylococcus haemolyticus]|uniref:DUF1542 domain-containing protein n=1 Tax=Staphylococcus haemolyticus TaxID=1283 RepID=UPI0034DD75E7
MKHLNATDEEKAEAKAKVDEAVNNAKASIDQAKQKQITKKWCRHCEIKWRRCD